MGATEWFAMATRSQWLSEGRYHKAIMEAHRTKDYAELGRLMSLIWSRHCTMANYNLLKEKEHV